MNFTTLWNNYLIYVADVIIVGYAMYKFINFIRGTKALNIFWGLLLIAIVTVIATKLKLPITSWLLKQFWLAGIIILAIVFQPELRNVLSEISIPRRSYQSLFIIEEIISAVKELAFNKHGALIVLEQNIGLKNFTKTGIIIDAEITKELLLSIFYPKNPLHDGAVIISKGRILAARCILPLSEESYCSSYGTRHRAACGIAQHSDAIAIVVSEEKGTISVVYNKHFNYNVSIEQLRELLIKKINIYT